MKIAVFTQSPSLRSEQRMSALMEGLSCMETYEMESGSDLAPDTDILLSVGGDGTFLSAASIVAGTGIPVLGVNFGRMGFLSEYSVDDVVDALKNRSYSIEEREMLQVRVDGGEPLTALNEVSIIRAGAAMLGIDVTIDAQHLPTYWADGLLVATSSGSTAYSLSVGGPICTPECRVLVISPVAPHNLNVRPLIVPSSSRLTLSLQSRQSQAILSVDNRHMNINCDSSLDVSLAQFSLHRVRLSETNFIGALRSKLFWGEDVRNESY